MEGKGAAGVAGYEFDMLEILSDMQTLIAPDSQVAWAMKNARTESIVLHTRQLCELFLSLSREDDNAKLADLVEDNQQSSELKRLIEELREKYGKRDDEDSPRRIFNKMLLHPTKLRVNGYNYQPELDKLRPLLVAIMAEIESVRGKFPRFSD